MDDVWKMAVKTGHKEEVIDVGGNCYAHLKSMLVSAKLQSLRYNVKYYGVMCFSSFIIIPPRRSSAQILCILISLLEVLSIKMKEIGNASEKHGTLQILRVMASAVSI